MTADTILVDTVAKILRDRVDKTLLDAAETGQFPEDLWQLLVENGLTRLACTDSGGSLEDVFAVLKEVGRAALPVPLAEVVFAKRWLESTDLSDDAFVSVGVHDGDGVINVPWGRRATNVLVTSMDRPEVMRIDGGCTQHEVNPAGEARDAQPSAHMVPLAGPADESCTLYQYLVLARAVQMAGCLERVLEFCIQYATEREQFGRPIAKFQAIQHNLAVMAGEVAAASRAADGAVAAMGSDRFAGDLATAKARTGEAAGIVAEMAHQVHGAMGFTHEHHLHHHTRRLWAWRDEFGNEAFWQRRIGAEVLAIPADDVWAYVAARG